VRIVSALGAGVLIGSAWLAWLDVPIRSPGAYGNPIWVVALGLGFLGLAAAVRRQGMWMALAGAGGLGLGAYGLLRLALQDPAFWLLVDEKAQYSQIVRFSSRHMQANFGFESSFGSMVATDTLPEQLATAANFIGWGCWLSMIGGILLLAGCRMEDRDRSLPRMALAAAVSSFVVVLAVLPGLAALAYQERGDRRMARGHYAEALRSYRKAMRWAPAVATSARYYSRVGAAHYFGGEVTHPAARFYMGERYARMDDRVNAIDEYLASRAGSEALRAVAHRRIAWTYVTLGLERYAAGDLSLAVGQWEQALAVDEAQLQAAYFLLRSYFDQGRYDRSVAIGDYFLDRSWNPPLNANVQASMGDAFWKLDDLERARLAYRYSIELDCHGNLGAMKKLGGT